MNNYESADSNKTFELKDFLLIIRKHKVIVLLTTIIVFAVIAYISYSLTPQFIASASINVENENSDSQLFDFNFGSGETYLMDQIEILKSRSLAEAVIDSLWRSPYRNKLYLINTRKYYPPTDKINKWLQKVFSLSLYSGKETELSSTEDDISIENLHLFSKHLRDFLYVDAKSQTNTIYLEYKSPDPVEAAYVMNLIIEIYKNIDIGWRSNEIVRLKTFLAKQLDKISKQLNEAEEKLKEYQEKEEVYTIEGNSQIILQQLANYESEYMTTLADVNISENQLKYEKKLLTDAGRKLVDAVLNTTDPQIQEMRNRLAEMEAQKVQIMIDNSMDANDKIVIELQSKIESLKENLIKETKKLLSNGIPVSNPISFSQELETKIVELNSNILQMKSRADEFKQIVDKYKDQVKDLPEKTMTLARLMRDKQVKEELFLLLSQKLEEARISEASQSVKIRVIDKAIPPVKASNTKLKFNLIFGLIIGFGFGIGIALIIDYSDNTIRSIEKIQKLGVSVIGIIPKIGERYNRKRRKEKQAGKNGTKGRFTPRFADRMITHIDPKNPIAEAYRSIRTNLTYSLPDKEIKSLIVTSPGAGEGKSTTVVNLAITFAQLGKKTLIIDTDLRKPILHHIFSVKREPGISNYLVQFEGVKEIDPLINKTEIQNLFILSSGKLFPNPSELIGSVKMKELIQQLVNEWDIVLFDSPPIMPVTDARILSKNVDGLVLVVKSGTTEIMALERTLAMLSSVKSPVLGCILNGFTRRDSYYYSDYQYYYYYEYYDYSDK